MANKMYRRVRRGGMMAGPVGKFLKGLAVAVGVTVLLVVIFALIVGMTDAADGVIRVVNQVIKLAAILLGVAVAVGKGESHGALRGGLLGLVYMGVGVFLYALLTGQQLSFAAYLMDVLMGVSVGGLFGMLRGAAQPQAAK